ncbi:unnamed protein product [Hymenolepis diminuta]|uniref:Exosome complex component RRP45 n=2 Tax=Hymenolepis diminuta TaxID=6216 RepID=A0A158QDM0_HYMDI|nr:unnamed protein product [Hymenolepis diminuta]
MLLSEAECTTLTQMLLSGVRLDGRTLKEYREINFRFPSGHPCGGCCIVSIGSTSVLAKVSAEVVEPKHYRPAQGVVYVNFDATLVSTMEGKRKGRTRDDDGRRLSSVLQTCFRDCVDVDALCIVAWERVFAIRVDLKALSYDGNLGDCGALATVAALASFRRPDVYVDDAGKVVVDTAMKRRPPVRLNLRRIPVLVTLGLTADTKVIIQDPTQREEVVMTGGRVMVGLTAHGELCCVHTSGLTTCITMANNRAKSLVALVHRVLEGLERQRSAIVAAAAARASDLDRANQQLLDVPLVLSSTSFLPGGENAPDGLKHVEEGEVAGDDDDDDNNEESSDMDLEGASEEEIKSGTTDGRNPYGFIEVSSLLAEREKLEAGGSDFEDLEGGIQSIESDVTARILPPRAKRSKISFFVKEEESEDDEEIVVQLS